MFEATTVSIIESYRPAWVLADGPESDVVISTRARLARNLVGKPFPSKATREDLESVVSEVITALEAVEDDFSSFIKVHLSDLGTLERLFLVDAHVASYDQLETGTQSVLLLDPGGQIAIMINEEDHIRLQSISSGLRSAEVWEMVDCLDVRLSGGVEYAFSKVLGYLTASPGNLGTGLRVSVMLHLGGLALMENADSIARASQILGMSVRGLYGEGTAALGDFYQVSNETSLGMPETEIIQRVIGVAAHYARKERDSREYLLRSERRAIVGLLRDSFDGIRRADGLSAETSLKCISTLRVGLAIGLVEGITMGDLNDLLVQLRAGDPALWYASRYVEQQTNGGRAVMFRRTLRNAAVVE